ncbi:MAG: UDP-2,3-diacylglucosamine diphosphatase [Acidiferrobacteraceae bacterium]
MTDLLISDLHLSPARPAIVRLFCDFLDHRARAASTLYILGDLFEYWIGDEGVAEPAVRPIIQGIQALTDSGVAVFLMHGNRDFLIGARFAEVTGAELLPDPFPTELAGSPVVLTHGDMLCTDDVDYQRFRSEIRRPEWIRNFLDKSVAERIAMAEQYRELSKNATSMKPADIMDVNPEAVTRLMREYAVHCLIHGHTHRPAHHRFMLDGANASRIVLGDWYEHGSVLECGPNGFTLERLSS